MSSDPLRHLLFSPLYDRVIVLPEEVERESSSGFRYADNSTGEDFVQKGTIIAIGKGRFLETGALEPIPLSKGEVVIFPMHAGDDILVSADGKVQRYKGKIITGTTLVKILRASAILSVITSIPLSQNE